MKIKVNARVSLTPRDLFLLFELYQNVVLSFPQVCRKAFSGKAKSTVMNRLAKLEGMGVLGRWRVPVLDSKRPGPGVFVVFWITRKGIGELKKWRPQEVVREKPLRLHGYAIHHDVLLVDVLDALREKFPGSTVTKGWRLTEKDVPNSIHPDAVLELPGGLERWAIELELTAKSEKRYREIVLRYRLQSAFTRVLYVTDSREVVNKLARVLEEMPEQLGTKPPEGKFMVVSLISLLPEKSMPAPSGIPVTKPKIEKEKMHE
jgi:hypothetical protein